MIIYQHHFCFVDEIIALIERGVNRSINSEKLEQYAQKGENKKIERMLNMIDEIGKAFNDNYKENIYLFKYLQEDDEMSLASLLCYSYCNYEDQTLEKQILSLRENARKYPQNFIKVLLSLHESDSSYAIENENTLHQIDCIPFDDSIKWKIWKIHTELEAFVELLCNILEYIYPILKSYQDVYEYYGKRYEEEINEVYEGKDLYSYICLKAESKIEGVNAYVYPSVGRMLSVSFIDSDSENVIFRYGVGMINKLIEIYTVTQEQLFDGLKILGDPSKFEILQVLGEETFYGAQLAEKLHLSTPTISYHMQSLINARFVTFEKKQNRLYYRMNKKYLQHFFKCTKEKLNI